MHMNLWQKFRMDHAAEMENKSFSMHFEKGVDSNLRQMFLSFSAWLRKNYCFPVHIHIYIKNAQKVRLQSGRMAYGSFRWFPKRPPRVIIPVKIEEEVLREYSLAEAHEMALSSLVHELTHYYQWVLDLEQSNAASERQANYFRYRIIDEYDEEKR